MEKSPHIPVLLHPVVEAFAPTHMTIFVDGTVGMGGHAQAILKSHPEIKLYLAIDQDPHALALAAEKLKPWEAKVLFRQGNFAQFETFLKEAGHEQADGLLVDLGVSSMQLDQAERGFSFSKDGPLDMRMDPKGSITAAEIVNTWSEKELGRIFRDYGEEKKWRLVAQTIITARKQSLFITTTDLTQALKSILPYNPKKGINPLTLVFQALRIAVNKELEVLELLLGKAFERMTPQGRLAVISFHSLEDRIVKTQMRLAASDKWYTVGIGGLFLDKSPVIRLITKKPMTASEEELHHNPRSRSAKLRVAEKL